MGLVLDSTILIDAERRTFDLEGLLDEAGDDTVAIAAITASEMLHGVERATDPAKRLARSRFVESLLDAIPPIPFGLVEARVHARLWATLATKGRMIGSHDMQVAATALSLECEVATLNQKEFKRVPGLVLTDVRKFVRR